MELPSVFTLFFRSNPYQGGYAITAGLSNVIDLLDKFRFSSGDIMYLSGLKTSSGKCWFEKPFLDFLANSQFECDVEAVPKQQWYSHMSHLSKSEVHSGRRRSLNLRSLT